MSSYSILLEQQRERAARMTPNPYGLTKRERDVAAWIGRGLEPSAIACKLSISERTVAGHVARITTKLGARNDIHLGLIINTLPGLPVEQPNVVAIEDFRAAFGMGWEPSAQRA